MEINQWNIKICSPSSVFGTYDAYHRGTSAVADDNHLCYVAHFGSDVPLPSAWRREGNDNEIRGELYGM